MRLLLRGQGEIPDERGPHLAEPAARPAAADAAAGRRARLRRPGAALAGRRPAARIVGARARSRLGAGLGAASAGGRNRSAALEHAERVLAPVDLDAHVRGHAGEQASDQGWGP